MNYYVLQVKTGGEEKFLKSANRSFARTGIESPPLLIWPRRRLRIRRQGKTKDVLAPIFPGYIFLEADVVEIDVYWAVRKGIGFYKFLRSNREIEPLSGQDKQLLQHFLRLGEVVEKSKVYFDENKRIRVTEGALKGLEGNVVKVDRRKRRAKVKLSLYDDSFLIDFGFEVMEPLEDNERAKE